MPGILRGYAVVSLCGWAVFPLVSRLLGALPDRGYALCRCFGWVLSAWLAWIAAWVAGRPLSMPLALGSIVLLGASIWLPAALRGRRAAGDRGSECERPLSLLRRRPGLIVSVEGLFLLGLLLFGALEARNPAIDPDSERFMDYAFLRSCLRSRGLPVMDPWFAGREAAYYHFGYALIAFLVRACGADPKHFVTAAIAVPYALLWIGSFGIGLALTGRARGGAWAAFLVLGAGSLGWIRQGAAAFRPGAFDWFGPSRTIQGTITEFPWFSLLWGDLHPYVIALPIVVCGLAFPLAGALEVLRRDAKAPPGEDAAWIAAGRAAAFALVGGAVLATHPWDFPLLLGVAFALAMARGGPGRIARLLAVATASALSGVLFLPFLKGLPFGAHAVGRVVLRSAPWEWLAAYGPFVLLAVLALPLLLSRERSGLAGTQRNGTGGGAATVLAVCALVTALMGEVVYVRDLFETTPLVRMNTIFKLHRFAWLLFGLASSPLLERLVAAGPGETLPHVAGPVLCPAGLRRAAGRLVLFLVLAASLVYPLLGTAAWLRGRDREARSQTDDRVRAALLPGADAEALFRALSPGDAAAASFMTRAAGSGDTLLEETGEPYTWSSRLSTFSGVPTVLGWGNHEAIWRQGWDEVLARGADVAAVYAQPGSSGACARLRAYGVKWIVVGERERRRYGDSVAAFGRLARPAFESDGTAVYVVEDICADAGAAPGGPQRP
jgi:uncharacterized membrane protein